MLSRREIYEQIEKLRLMLRWAMVAGDYESQHRYTTAILHLKDCLMESMALDLKGAA